MLPDWDLIVDFTEDVRVRFTRDLGVEKDSDLGEAFNGDSIGDLDVEDDDDDDDDDDPLFIFLHCSIGETLGTSCPFPWMSCVL